MPDSSDSSAPDPKSPEVPSPEKASDATGGKVPGPAPLAEPLSLVPRSRSAPRESAAPTGQEGAPASFTDFVNWMKVFSSTMEAPPVEPPKPGAKLQRGTMAKTQRKFQRFDKEAGTSEVPAEMPPGSEVPPVRRPMPSSGGVEDASDIPNENERPASPSGPPVPIALTGGSSTRRPKATAERRPYFWLALQVGAFVLLVVAFFLGKASVSKPAAEAKNAAPAAPSVAADGTVVDLLNPAAVKMIDEAMAAEQDRDFDKATDLLLKIQKDHPHVRDLDFRLAMLALEKNDAAKALPLLNLSIAEGEQAAAAYKLRGTILNRKGGGNRGISDFENSTMVDPFTAENFFFWGEALRRLGKPQAALVKLQQAIDRLREPALETQYRLKIRLTQIELGREQEFAKEMAERLAENPPVPDWLLTAAAIELHRNNLPAAAGYLDKAATYMDKELFMLRMRDYYFYSYRFEKALSRFFAFANTAAATPAAGASPGPDAAGSPAPAITDAASLLQGPTAPTPAALPSANP